MAPVTYLWIGLAVSFGAFVQGAVGFAFGIFSIPLLVWVGLPLPSAIPLVLTLVTVQTISGCVRHADQIPWPEVWKLSAYRFAAIPVGMLLLRQAQALPEDRIKQGVGIFLLLAVALQTLVRPRPRARLTHGWSMVAGLTSGLLAGLVGMGGAPVVLWAMAHDWSTIRARVCLWAMFMIMAPWQLAVYMWGFGVGTVGHSILLGLLYFPLVVWTSHQGTLVGNRVSAQRMRWVVYGLLVVIGTSSILAPYWG